MVRGALTMDLDSGNTTPCKVTLFILHGVALRASYTGLYPQTDCVSSFPTRPYSLGSSSVDMLGVQRRSTSFIRDCFLLGPCSEPMPRALWWS